MISKTIEKSAKSERSAASLRVSGKGAKSDRAQAATMTMARKHVVAEQHPGEARVTKHEQLIKLLKRPEGASIEDMMQATEWQQHSVRGFLAGTVKKKLGLALMSLKAEGDVRRYRIATRRGR